ncbi:22929_t:CDS:2, partial [Gigaspora margarita]
NYSNCVCTQGRYESINTCPSGIETDNPSDEEKAEGNNGYSLFFWSDDYIIKLIDNLIKAMKRCNTEQSIKDRLLLTLNLVFYICYGISLAIARAIGPCTNKDWAYLPVALSWTLAPIIVIIGHWMRWKLCIEEPFNIERNLGNRVSYDGFKKIRKEFPEIYYEHEYNNDGTNIITNIITTPLDEIYECEYDDDRSLVITSKAL